MGSKGGGGRPRANLKSREVGRVPAKSAVSSGESTSAVGSDSATMSRRSASLAVRRRLRVRSRLGAASRLLPRDTSGVARPPEVRTTASSIVICAGREVGLDRTLRRCSSISEREAPEPGVGTVGRAAYWVKADPSADGCDTIDAGRLDRFDGAREGAARRSRAVQIALTQRTGVRQFVRQWMTAPRTSVPCTVACESLSSVIVDLDE